MSDINQKLLDTVRSVASGSDGNRRNIVYIEGGYYDTRFGPTDFSFNTLNSATQTANELIKKEYNITRVSLGVLINNIGISCGEDVCVIPTAREMKPDQNDATVPDSLEEILKNTKIQKSDQIVTNERTLRNRGIRTARIIADNEKEYAIEKDINNKGETLYNIMIDGKKIPLAIRKDEKWAARCPLIMGQHYSDLYIKFAKKYGKNVGQILIDMSDMYDRHKVNNGAKVAFLILKSIYGYDTSNLKIINFSFGDDELTQFEEDITIN
ncbi:MAG TPA: hypothetical protein VG965_01535 [Patescibacteria group bacterium]|nr:hypothetical protein [Patescibacteria group bacterium]